MRNGGFSQARLGRMHDVMARHVAHADAPGMVTLLGRHGEVHVDAIGMKALGGSDPMRRDTIFRITSMTKPITAAATMILVGDDQRLAFPGSSSVYLDFWTSAYQAIDD